MNELERWWKYELSTSGRIAVGGLAVIGILVILLSYL